MKKLYVFLAFLTVAATLNAQPQGYYDGTEGLTGNALKTALHNIIKNDDHVSYNGMWSAYQVTDKRPGTNYVWDIYSDVPGSVPPYNFTFVTDQCGSYNGEGDCYNREHLWAQSWTNNDGTHKTDLHHVYPTDGFVNGKRGNYAFGEVRNPSWTSRNGGKLGANTTSRFNGTVFEPIEEYKGDIMERTRGSLVCFEAGTTTQYGLYNAQERCTLFVGAGIEVYEGMIVGENSREDDIVVNVCKKKQLTNNRASGSDEALKLITPTVLSLEQCLEFIAEDELVEITPKSIRLRKKILSKEQRMKLWAKNKK